MELTPEGRRLVEDVSQRHGVSVDAVLTLLQAVAANLAAARNDAVAYRLHCRQATEQTAALPDPEDRAVLEATLRVLPVPDAPA